jgi:hypothetical protein
MHLIGRYIELPSSNVYHQGLKIALARSQWLSFLTAGLPSFVTRKARRTSAYKIYPPINFKYIDEMMTFLYKSKFPMINIAIIITITESKSFPAMVRRFYFWNNSLSRPRDISIDQLLYTHSGFRYFWSPKAPVLYIHVHKKRWLTCGVGQSWPMDNCFACHKIKWKISAKFV